MNKYIFLTHEGYTYQPGSESTEPDIENMQVIGFSKGETPEGAFENLLKEKYYIKRTSFDEVSCYKMDNDYRDLVKVFNIKTE